MKKIQSTGGIVINKNGMVAMVSNRGVSWSLPKGKIDPGELPLEAACREVYEETGIKRMKLVKELGEYSRYRNGPNGTEDRSEFKTIHVFMFRAEKRTLKPVDVNNPEAKWASKKEALSMLSHRKDKAFFKKFMHLIKSW